MTYEPRMAELEMLNCDPPIERGQRITFHRDGVETLFEVLDVSDPDELTMAVTLSLQEVRAEVKP